MPSLETAFTSSRNAPALPPAITSFESTGSPAFFALQPRLREEVLRREALMRKIETAPVLQRAYKEVAPLLHLSEKSVCRLHLAWRKRGWIALADGRKLPVSASGAPRSLADNKEFAAFFFRLQEEHQRGGNTQAAIRRLRRMWAAGERIPGFGTWREWWALEYPGVPPPLAAETPRAWSSRNLARLRPPRCAIALATKGFLAAKAQRPVVRRSTRELRPMELLTADDFRCDFEVMVVQRVVLPDGRALAPGVHKVACLVVVDVFTRRILGWCAKIMARLDEGPRSVIKSEDLAFAAAVALAEHGLPKDYPATFLLENATANFTKAHRATLALLFGKRVLVENTGTFSDVLEMGGYREGGGDPGHKGWVEAIVRAFHEETAHLPGQIGRRYDEGPAHRMGEHADMDKLLERLGQLDSRAGHQAASRLMRFEEAQKEISDAIDRLNARYAHNCEGFDRIAEWRYSPKEPWKPESLLVQMSHEERILPREIRVRNETPVERWNRCYRRERFDHVPQWHVAPLISEPRRVTAACGQIVLRRMNEVHYFYSDARELAALVADGREYDAYWHPVLDPEIVHLFHAKDGTYAGSLPRAAKPGALDYEALSAAGGITRHIANRHISEWRERHPEEAAIVSANRAANRELERAVREAAGAKNSEDAKAAEKTGAPGAPMPNTPPRHARFLETDYAALVGAHKTTAPF